MTPPRSLQSTSEAGRLVLVVGPSGVGKDTLLDGARARLADKADVIFARREITRPADAGGEEHTAVTPAEFAARAQGGHYLLHWDAHGLSYGIPSELGEALAAGRTVVANVSRGVLDAARARIANVRVVSIEASPRVIADRLAARGREPLAAIEARLARGAAFSVDGEDVVKVRNDGALATAIDALVAAIAD